MGNIDIGINEKDRESIAEGLKHLLADSYTLYLQTHNFSRVLCCVAVVLLCRLVLCNPCYEL